MAKPQKKRQTPKRRKKKVKDPEKEEETRKRIAAIEGKRQKVIEEVRLSLLQRRRDKIGLERDRQEKEERAREKERRDAAKTGSERTMLEIREDLSRVVETGIKCVYTSVIIPNKIKYDGKSTLSIKGVKYKVKKNLHIVGWGKEAVTMSAAFERIIGRQLKRGWVVVPRKSIFMMWSFPEAFPKLDSAISYVEAGTDGQPDEKSVTMTRRIINYCKKLKRKDLLIVMLSHGIDDLLCCPREEITLRDKLRVINRLKAAQATPDEINTVRNKLSTIRGGDLARFAYPARVIVLITSDVSAEPMTQLSGGPCVYDPKDDTALQIMTKYGIFERLPQSVRELLEETIPWTMVADKQVTESKKYKFVHEYVVACNADAMECMAVEVFKLGLFPVKLNSTCFGEVQEFAREYVKITSLMILAVEGKINQLDMYQEMKESPVCPLTDKKVHEIFPAKDKWGLGLCLLLGGRQTVNLCAEPGKGGPNQELALYFSLYWYMRTEQFPILREYTVWFLGGSSHGKDGNTSAAGAFGYKSLGTDVYPKYEKALGEYNTAYANWWKLKEDKQNQFAIERAYNVMKDHEATRNKFKDIIPKHSLEKNDTNTMFISINDEDELLELKTGNYYTFTDVGDLHIIRIVKFQCNCDGICHGHIERTCIDKECPVNVTMSAETNLKSQYCCQMGRLIEKL
ncbi:PREDICTED: glycerate kinase-like [Dufourea novaeangliae]|uniref:Glycerate kinase n=1 Tax=Dufourea novaeangliae TaxID=178035 RepID=A0A154PDY7_DUFNO|nr:PREDICTED: glycerate kinase-like [Dufourea novaeangliae]KZC09400.1 Glycerate kinase [Dufourea novaeangliae]